MAARYNMNNRGQLSDTECGKREAGTISLLIIVADKETVTEATTAGSMRKIYVDL